MASRAEGLSEDDLVAGFRASGLGAGDVVLIHTALRTLGRVNGGAEAVRDALLEVIGPTGTLVAPTFTFIHEVEAEPIIDPANDRSEMGAITEAVRRHPDARRSIAFRHSFAAIGPAAEAITGVDPALAPFDLASAFGTMLRLGTQVLLIGVPYSNSTSHHFAEWVAQVPYRHALTHAVRVRRPDGSLEALTMGDYQPRPSNDGTYYGSRATDFNRLGRMLEERGRSQVVVIGNAIVRHFAMKALVDLATDEARRDHNIFRTPDGQPGFRTELADGVVAFSDDTVDGAGRPERHVWSVVSADGMFRRG